MKIIINGLGLVVVGYSALILYQYAEIIGFVLIAITGLAGFGFIAFTSWYAYEKMMILHADRVAREKEAHVMVVTQGPFVGIRDTSKRASDWQVFNAPKQVVEQNMMLPETIEQSIDLLARLDNVQRCLIVGASDTGKTTLLQHLVTRRQATSKVIVIDPHAYPGKWPGCMVVGQGRDYDGIAQALDALIRLMLKRYGEIGRGDVAEMGHEKRTILIDEWRSIVHYCGDEAKEAIRALLTESRKAAFSVFVATHSDRVKALGIEGEGDLKDGFAIVKMSRVNGHRQATINTGDGDISATLPGPFDGLPQPIIEADVLDITPRLSEIEQQVVDLYNNNVSISDISEAVFGHKGGHQNDKVKEILRRCKV